ncbi:D-aminoacyl-tRNA deacylase-like [Daphnia carinata]|uniref:D-aminoacyl-tRNA deacylase-like n=1 Tax=Daphnia carinata TaxID=120202 RepID=UPI00257F964C|nr:D-aminoacyl-tRNA deacylase-like [Daphnia carinata]
MKAILQRVLNAKVVVDGIEASSIQKGVLVFVGLAVTDTEEDAEYIARKILNIRLFEDENQKRWAKSTADLNLEILCVSQFTLYHKLKGNKPDFRQAMSSKESKVLYGRLLSILQTSYNPSLIKDGVFGAHMCVMLENDGPVTLEIDSNHKSSSNTLPSQVKAD